MFCIALFINPTNTLKTSTQNTPVRYISHTAYMLAEARNGYLIVHKGEHEVSSYAQFFWLDPSSQLVFLTSDFQYAAIAEEAHGFK